MYNFDVAEGKHNASRKFTINTDDFKWNRYIGPSDKRSLEKKSVKLGHLMARLFFVRCHLVTRVTSETVDVKNSAAAKAVVKAR